jgi:hypothetical protein
MAFSHSRSRVKDDVIDGSQDGEAWERLARGAFVDTAEWQSAALLAPPDRRRS